eukprot:SAG31_NODE_36437_length_313_cov_0.962617_1_plen_29_part_10
MATHRESLPMPARQQGGLRPRPPAARPPP